MKIRTFIIVGLLCIAGAVSPLAATVRTNASGDYLLRTASLPALSGFSITGWAKHRSAQTGTYAMLASLESGSVSAASSLTIGFFPDAGNQITYYDGSTVGGSIGNPALDTWFFFAMTVNGTGMNGMKAYFGDLAGSALVSATSTAASFTPGAMFVGNDSVDEWCDCSFRNVKVYDVALSAGEVEVERWASDPQKTSDLHLWTPLIGDTADDSGNSKDWTEGGSIGIESGQPPLRPYTTTFGGGNENPLSEDGIWLNGDADGADWQNMKVLSGNAVGVAVSAGYDDNAAALKGKWAADQSITGTIYNASPDHADSREIGLYLNRTISANVNSGYEFLIEAQDTSTNAYVVRWNGPYSDFDVLGSCTGGTLAAPVVSGDVAEATNTGGTLVLKINSSTIITCTDSTFTGGAPGIGTFGRTTEDTDDFGWSDITANDGMTTFAGGGGGTVKHTLSLLGAGK